MTLEDCRQFYAEEIRFSANLTSSALIEAFGRVPRENFLGPPPWQLGSPAQRAMSAAGLGDLVYFSTSDPRHLYHNVVVALDVARNINNGQPRALGIWINALGLKPGDRVFHLGCGVGYYTAIMAEVVGPAGSVVAIDFEADLAARARANLAAYSNVTIHSGDGAALDPGRYDAMLINAGVTHPHSTWLDRLHDGGRLVLPLTISLGVSGLGQGVMVRFTRRGEEFSAEIVSAVGIYSCKSVRDPQREPLLLKAFSSGGMGKLKSLRRDAHEQASSCLVHGTGICLSTENV